jgi:hypothetical protein
MLKDPIFVRSFLKHGGDPKEVQLEKAAEVKKNP